MGRRLIPVLWILALVFVVTACGDDGGTVFGGSTTITAGSSTTGGSTTTAGSTTTGGVTTSGDGSSALAGLLSGALAESAGADTTLGPGGEEECMTSGLADAIGAARFAELDAIATSAADMSEVFSLMTDTELSALVDVIVGCVDVEAMLTEQMGGSDFSPEAATCFAGSLSQGDTMKNLILAMMTGGDPATNPELMQIMIQVMTQDCAGPLEAMLVDEFIASGASAEEAACVAGEFMRGGLFEAVMDSMLGGTDFTTDPELNAQMQQIIIGCTTPAAGSLVEVGTPIITGQALPQFATGQDDTAVGVTIPEVVGADFSGTPVSITRDGRPKMILFFAHWCSVCQQEVPLVADWLGGATLPEGLDFISVSTGVVVNGPNYPPSEWLEREDWTVPVILDDVQSSVGAAFGLSAYPYFVFVDADGRVVLRVAGALPTEAIELIISQLMGA